MRFACSTRTPTRAAWSITPTTSAGSNGRSDLLDLLGIDQRAALESGEGLYTVAEVNIRYLSPARLGDGVVIDTHALQVGRVSCTLRQVARRGEIRLAEATVKVGFISPEGRPRRQPADWQHAFASLLSEHPKGQE